MKGWRQERLIYFDQCSDFVHESFWLSAPMIETGTLDVMLAFMGLGGTELVIIAAVVALIFVLLKVFPRVIS